MKYKMRPVIWIDDVADGLNAQYGWNWDGQDLAQFLFGDNYYNDSCQSLWIADLEYYRGEPWQDENEISLMNAIKIFLQDILPAGTDTVIIDTSW